MRYDPVKDRLGTFFSRHPALTWLFYNLLDFFFLRAWYVHRALRSFLPTDHSIRVLDAGTGFGQYAHFVLRTFPHARVVAVDIKEEYLVRARDFFDRTAYKDRIVFAQEDLTDLHVSGSFDCILAVDVMEHIEDDESVLNHFARVLATGGYVCINTPSDLGGSDAHVEGEGGFIDEHVREGYNRQELETKLRSVGLEPVQSLYTYGRYGSMAWRMLIKYPLRWLNTSWLLLPFVFLYYGVALPVGSLLNTLDMWMEKEEGTGLLIIARKTG